MQVTSKAPDEDLSSGHRDGVQLGPRKAQEQSDAQHPGMEAEGSKGHLAGDSRGGWEENHMSSVSWKPKEENASRRKF